MSSKPRMDPIRWDTGAADAAASALRRAAQQLRESVHNRRNWATQAQASWEGRHRQKFDGDLDHMLLQAQSLANEYEAKADEIARRSHEAWRAELRRRDAVRQWEEEQRRKRRS